MKPLLRIPNFNHEYTSILCAFYDSTQYAQQRKVPIEVPADVQEAKTYLASFYAAGWGLKVLARELGLTYTKTRILFQRLSIPLRIGKDVVTIQCRNHRKEMACRDDNPWRDWTNKTVFHNKKMGRGVQGWYVQRDGNKVWLRSTWEYIYAKWLDAQNIHWTTETQQYQLSDGTGYRPDFNIFNEDGELTKIVEVKGYYTNRLYKTALLREEYGIDVEIILNIAPYTTLGYNKERRLWKALVQ